jgi:hypothetical protein
MKRGGAVLRLFLIVFLKILPSSESNKRTGRGSEGGNALPHYHSPFSSAFNRKAVLSDYVPYP